MLRAIFTELHTILDEVRDCIKDDDHCEALRERIDVGEYSAFMEELIARLDAGDSVTSKSVYDQIERYAGLFNIQTRTAAMQNLKNLSMPD